MRPPASFILSAAALFAALATAMATDVPYGADTLPYAADRASLVAEASGGSRVPIESPLVSLYQVKLGRVIHGDVAAPDHTVLVSVSKGIDLHEAAEFARAIIFLAGPLSPKQKTEFGLPADGSSPVYSLIAGELGLVKAETPSLAQEIKNYLTSTDRLAWASRNLEEPNLYLQRSAVAETRSHPENPAALAVLDRAISSKKVAPAVKLDAVREAGNRSEATAVAAVKKAAADQENPMAVRRTAIKVLSTTEAGKRALHELQASGDPVLSSQAIHDNERPKPTPEASITGTLAEKLATLQNLKEKNTADAANKLKAVALDKGQDELVRQNAILSITSMESGIGRPALNEVAEKLQEPALKQFASDLAQ